MTVKLTLYFENEEEKNYFVGQLSDGFGENYVELKNANPYRNTHFPVSIYDTDHLDVTNIRDPYGEDDSPTYVSYDKHFYYGLAHQIFIDEHNDRSYED